MAWELQAGLCIFTKMLILMQKCCALLHKSIPFLGLGFHVIKWPPSTLMC